MSGQEGDYQAFISSITEIVLANLSNEEFGVEDFVQKSGMSHYALSHKLHEITGKTINQFIRETRLKKAHELLNNKDFTVAEVAYKTGFGSATYFNTCFNDFFGYPPGAVKKGILKTDPSSTNLKNIAEPDKKKVVNKTMIYTLAAILFIIPLIYVVKISIERSDSFLPGNSMGESEKSIAVLPFKNLSDSASNQYFIDGTMEEILTNLSQINDLRVISRTSVERFRNSTLSASEIGEKLKVDYIVEASGQKIGNNFKLRVQLIDAANDRHVWAESYEQEINEAKDIFKIQGQVAKTIAAELHSTITPEEIRLIEEKPSVNLTAYDFYQKGKNEAMKFWSNNDNWKALYKAKDMFNKALEYDSSYAMTYIGLADFYLNLNFFRSHYSRQYLDTVLIFIDRALEIDNKLAEGYYIKGLYYTYNGNPDRAIIEFDKALKYNPKFSDVYVWMGKLIYLNDSRHSDYVKAIETFYKAMESSHGGDFNNPLTFMGDAFGIYAGFPEKGRYYYNEALKFNADTTLYLNQLARLELISGNGEKAVELLKVNYGRDSSNFETIDNIGKTLYSLGQYRESLKYYNKIIDKYENLVPMTVESAGGLVYSFWMNGLKKEAEYWYNKQKNMSEESIKLGRQYSSNGYAYYNLAAVDAFMGKKESAYANLREFANRQTCPLEIIFQIKNDPLFNYLRNEKEFQKIVSTLENKYITEHERVRKWLEEKDLL